MLHESQLFVGKISSLYAKARPTLSTALVDYVLKYAGKDGLKTGVMLDVGCGPGLNTPFFAAHFEKIIAIDVSPTQIEEAQKANTFLNVTYQVGDATALPCADQSVDVVTSFVAVHWFDREAFFRECGRVLKPGGVLVIAGYFRVCLDSDDQNKVQKFKDAFDEFSNDIEKAGFIHEKAQLVRNSYKDIVLPYPEDVCVRDDPKYYTFKKLTISELINYFTTWSCYNNFCDAHPDNTLVQKLRQNLTDAVFDGSAADSSVIPVAFEWYFKMCKKPT